MLAKELPMTVGLVFNHTLTRVLLVTKDRGPSFNVGKLNGLGGKMEQGESARQCISREVHEESGLLIPPAAWACFHIEKHLPRAEQTQCPKLYFMTHALSAPAEIKQQEGEEVIGWQSVSALHHLRCVYNLNYLIAMALCWHREPNHRWIEG